MHSQTSAHASFRMRGLACVCAAGLGACALLAQETPRAETPAPAAPSAVVAPASNAPTAPVEVPPVADAPVPSAAPAAALIPAPPATGVPRPRPALSRAPLRPNGIRPVRAALPSAGTNTVSGSSNDVATAIGVPVVRAPVDSVNRVAHASPPAVDPTLDTETKAPALKFENSPSDMLLQAYALETGRTLLTAPDAPKAVITLRSQTDLTRGEYLQAIQTVLNMNNIALLPVGDKFLKVVPAATYRPAAPPTIFEEPENGRHKELGAMVSQMIQLRYITIDEVKTAIEGFKRPQGAIQLFERTNSILVTDAAENVNRILEIIRFVDQPRAVREVVNVRPIRFAKAANIKQRLDEIVSESQKAQQAAKETPVAKATGAPGIVRSTTPLPVPAPLPGVLRAPLSATPAPAVNNPIVEALMDEAERGVIRGKVQILADERTNIMIIITQPENMTFFDRIINVFDVPTTPDVVVEVIRLEYANAVGGDKDEKGVVDLLNELIGNSKTEQQPKGVAQTGAAAGAENKAGDGTPRSESLATFAERMRQPPAAAAAASGESGKSRVGELSKDNIKILGNKRNNAVIIMASRADVAALKEIIRSMDIMLSQVLIETVVLDVSLNSGIDTGIDWIQGLTTAGKVGSKLGKILYAGGGGGGMSTPMAVSAVTNLAAAGIQYFFSLPEINVDAVIKASATDGRAKILSSPVLLTQDNKEATIEATQLRYLFKGYTTSGYNANGTPVTQANVDQRNVGLTVKVTPRINQKGLVVLKVEETFEDLGTDQEIDGQKWPTTTTRKLSADIAVRSGDTVILGGLVRNEKKNSSTKIPLLGDIPFIGPYLFGSTSRSDNRSELLVFLTPYVLDTPEAMQREASRRKDYLDVKGLWTKGWSDSRLADETIVQKMKREQAERAAAHGREENEKALRNASETIVVRQAGTMTSTVTTNVLAPASGSDLMPRAGGTLQK